MMLESGERTQGEALSDGDVRALLQSRLGPRNMERSVLGIGLENTVEEDGKDTARDVFA